MSTYQNPPVMRTYPQMYAYVFFALVVAVGLEASLAWRLLIYVVCLGFGFVLGFAARAYRVLFPELSWWGVVRCGAPLPGEHWFPRLSLSVWWVVSLVGVVGSCWVGVRLLVDGSGWAVVWVLVANGWVVALGWWWERPESIVRHRSAVTEAVVSPAARVTMPVVDVGSDPGWPRWGFVPGVALVWSRVGRGDGLVWLRWMSLAFGHGPLVVAGLVVLLTASVSRSGVWRPGLAVVVGVGMVVVAVVGVVTRGGLSCVGLFELRQGYITRFLWRAGCAQVVVFVGLFGFLFSGVVWLVVVGVVVSAVMMGWAAPTRWRLGRDQARLVGAGCGLVLVVALRS